VHGAAWWEWIVIGFLFGFGFHIAAVVVGLFRKG